MSALMNVLLYNLLLAVLKLAIPVAGRISDRTEAMSNHCIDEDMNLNAPLSTPLLDLRVYARFSFYTPADKTGSVVIDMPLSSSNGSFVSHGFWTQAGYNRSIPITVTDEESGSQLFNWVFPVINTTGTEYNFSVAAFPPRDTDYPLHLWATDDNGTLMYESQTSIRVLTDDEGQKYAREDRLTKDILVSDGLDKRAISTLPSFTVVSNPSILAGMPRPFKSVELSWRPLLSVNVQETRWDHVHDMYKNDTLAEHFERIKLNGYNVVRFANSTDIQVPFNAVVSEVTSLAKSYDIHILYGGEWRAPGSIAHHENILAKHRTPFRAEAAELDTTTSDSDNDEPHELLHEAMVGPVVTALHQRRMSDGGFILSKSEQEAFLKETVQKILWVRGIGPELTTYTFETRQDMLMYVHWLERLTDREVQVLKSCIGHSIANSEIVAAAKQAAQYIHNTFLPGFLEQR